MVTRYGLTTLIDTLWIKSKITTVTFHLLLPAVHRFWPKEAITRLEQQLLMHQYEPTTHTYLHARQSHILHCMHVPCPVHSKIRESAHDHYGYKSSI